jgi:anti-sigma regulatory factor (Ser/Thr protein kinase)
MTTHQLVKVHEPTQVGEARRAATELARSLGFDDVACGRVALVATELGTNLARHANGGRILIAECASPMPGSVELLSIDDGPGVADLDRCLLDGYSSAGTPGTGLGAVRRLADEFDGHSTRGRGTLLMARIAPRRIAPGPDESVRFRYGAISVAMPGELVCGDRWSVAERGSRFALMVADGLGHGPLAADAARVTESVFDQDPFAGASVTLSRSHTASRGTRGAAAAVALLDRDAASVTFAGIGNVAGRLASGVEDRSMLSQHGTLGLQTRTPRDIAYALPEHGLVLLHSDGITTRWSLGNEPSLLQRHPALLAAHLYRDHAPGRDDATVVVVRAT